MTVAVIGGAGYIGAHVVRSLRERGASVLVVDDLSAGREERVADVALVRLDVTDVRGVPVLAEALARSGVEAVVHLAARKRAEESVRRPAWYYSQNITGLATVLMAMESAGVPNLVFSSSAAVYGNPSVARVNEMTPTEPVNPYGQTKLAGEQLVRASVDAWGLRAVSLRYFNVAGADALQLGDVGSANLVPAVLSRLAAGERPVVFGADYPTPDGSCVRDYVHVVDVADAHTTVLAALRAGRSLPPVLNVGTGRGASVLEVISAVSTALDRPIDVDVLPRRAGDPAAVVASVDLVRDVLGWQARHGLTAIVESAVRTSPFLPVPV